MPTGGEGSRRIAVCSSGETVVVGEGHYDGLEVRHTLCSTALVQIRCVITIGPAGFEPATKGL